MDKILEQMEALHDCKRGLTVATSTDYYNWWRTMEKLLAVYEATKFERGMALLLDRQMTDRDSYHKAQLETDKAIDAVQTRLDRPGLDISTYDSDEWPGDSADSRRETPMCQYHDETPKRCLEPVVSGTEHCKFHAVGEGQCEHNLTEFRDPVTRCLECGETVEQGEQ